MMYSDKFKIIYEQTVAPLRSSASANTLTGMMEYVKLFSDTLIDLDKNMNETANELRIANPEAKEQITEEYHEWMEQYINEFKPGRKE